MSPGAPRRPNSCEPLIGATDEGSTTAMVGAERAGRDGVDLVTQVHGAGRPTLLLHAAAIAGPMISRSTIPALAAGRQVIVVDLGGIGAGCPRGRSIGDLALDVVRSLSDRGVARADVVGVGLGGLVALELAIGHARTVDRVVLVSAHYRPDGYRPEAPAPEMRSGPPAPRGAVEPAVTAAPGGTLGDAEWAALSRATTGLAGRFRGWAPAELAAVAAPTLVVVGDHDHVRLAHAVEMFELIPGSQLAVVPGATHADLLHRPGPLVSLIDRFLTP